MVAVLPEPSPEFLVDPTTVRRYWPVPLTPPVGDRNYPSPRKEEKRNEGRYTAGSTPRPAARTVDDYTVNPAHSLFVPSFTAPDPTPEPYSGGGGHFGGGGASGGWSGGDCGGGDSGDGSCGSD